MNKYLLIFVFIVFFSSCAFFSQNDVETIKSTVKDVETIVKKQDSTVQNAIDNRNFNYINTSSDLAIDSINQKLEIIKQLDVDNKVDSVKQNAIAYIISMKEIVKSLRFYSTLNDSTSIIEAKKIDLENTRAINEANASFSKYRIAVEKLH